jgi:hypothetical protein
MIFPAKTSSITYGLLASPYDLNVLPHCLNLCFMTMKRKLFDELLSDLVDHEPLL